MNIKKYYKFSCLILHFILLEDKQTFISIFFALENMPYKRLGAKLA